MSAKFCMNCGTNLPPEAKFCCACGAPQAPVLQPDPTPPPVSAPPSPTSAPDGFVYVGDPLPKDEFKPFAPAAAPEQKKPSDKRSAIKLVKNALLLALAFVMLIMAFLPVVGFDIEELLETAGFDDVLDYIDDPDDIELRISPIKAWLLSLDALKELDEEDLLESTLTEDLEDLMNDLPDELDSKEEEITDEGIEIFNRILWIQLRLSLQGEDADLSPALAAFWVLSTVYILLAVTLFILSLLNLLSHFAPSLDHPLLSKALTTVFTLMPVVTVALLYAAISFTGTQGIFIGGGPIVILILSAVAVGMLIAHSIAFEEHQAKLRPIARIIACVLALTVVLLCFAPLVTTVISTEFRNASAKRTASIRLNSSFFNELSVSGSEKEAFDALEGSTKNQTKARLEELFSVFKIYTRKQVANGAANAEIVQMNKSLMASEGLHKLLFVFRAIPLLNLFVLLFAGFILQQSLYYLVHRSYATVCVAISRWLVVLMAVLSLALVITFVVLSSYFIDKYAPKGYEINIAAGIIALTVFSIALACVPSSVKREKRINAVRPLQLPNSYYSDRY